MPKPKMYPTPEQLKEKVDAYFTTRITEYAKEPLLNDSGEVIGEKIQLDKWGKPVILNRNPPTLNGLVIYLGMASRECFDRYADYDEQLRQDGDTTENDMLLYSDIITQAKAKIALAHEEAMFDPEQKPQGHLFLLSIMGMRDKKEIDVTSKQTVTYEIKGADGV